MVKTSIFFVFGIFGHPRTHYRGDFFCLRFVFAKIEKKKFVTEFAKEKSKLWAPVVMHKVHNAYGLPPDRQNTQFLRFFALFGAQKPNSGVEIFRKKNFFF